MNAEKCGYRRPIARSESGALGFFDSFRRVATQIVTNGIDLNDELVTAVHESLHRDLEVSTELGAFEGFVAMHSEVSPKDLSIVHDVLNIVFDQSWVAHESVATYLSIWQVLGNDPCGRQASIRRLSNSYEGARQMLATNFEAWMTDEATRLVACQLCKVLSMAALDVPILREFKTFGDVTAQRLSDFLISWNPDRRQRDILVHIAKETTLSELMGSGLAFVEQQQASRGVPSTTAEVIAEASRLDMHLSRELRPLLTNVVPWETRDTAEHRWREAFRQWVSPYGRRVAALLHHHQPELDRLLDGLTTERDASSMLDFRVELQQEGKAAREKVGYALLKVREIPRYVDVLRSCGADALIVVDRNSLHGSVKTCLGELLPGELGLVVLPWQWGGDDRFKAIQAACNSIPSQGRAIVICPLDALSEIGEAFRAINVVWAFSVGSVTSRDEAVGSTNTLPGLKLYWIEGSSGREILEFFNSIERYAPTKYFYWRPAKVDEKAGPQFIVVVLEGGNEIHLFPLTFMVFVRVEESLSTLVGVSRMTHDDVAKSKLSEILSEFCLFVIERKSG